MRFSFFPSALARVRWVHWLSSRFALVAGLTLAGALVSAMVWMSWRGHRQQVDIDLQRAALFAKVFEDHATRSFDSVAVVLNSLSEVIVAQDAPGELADFGREFSQVLTGLPFVRSMAVIDGQGRVLASSNRADLGQIVDLARLGPRPEPGRSLLGGVVRGRGLVDIAVNREVGEPRPGLMFIPLLSGFTARAGSPLWMVALINPDSLVNYQQLALGDSEFSAQLLDLQARVLTSTSDMVGLPGSNAAAHSVFVHKKVALEHGAFVEEEQASGHERERHLVAFRSSRNWPMVLIVEQPYAVSAAAWLERARPALVIGGVLVLALVAMSLAIWHSMRAREQARLLYDRAQDQVLRGERELSGLLRSLQDLIFRTDALGVVTFVNARWERLRSPQGGEVVGARLLEVMTPVREADRQALFAQEPHEGARHCRASMRDGRGQWRQFEVTVVPMFVDGRVAAFAGSAVDISELLEAQQQLQMQLSLTGQLLELSPQAISMVDDRDRLVMVNRAWEMLKGRRREDVIGRRMDEFLPLAEWVQHDAAARQLAEGGGEVRQEVRITRSSDGGQRDALMSKVRVHSESGALVGVLTVLTDVTEFREAERTVREARDIAEEASRAKSEFVANMSHELRTPLQSIIGFSELGLMLGGHDRLVPMFQDILNSGQRMLALVNDLLDVAKIESPVGTFHLERIDLRGPIRTVAREFTPQVTQKHLGLQLELPQEALVAKADPLRFQQVVRNVLANAIKFAPEGSQVTVRATLMATGHIQLVVLDEGPGIPEAELDKIFEAFVQSSKTKDGSGGTGLGLAICRKIVEGHGGTIQASNRPEGGACFQIELPGRLLAADTQASSLD